MKSLKGVAFVLSTKLIIRKSHKWDIQIVFMPSIMWTRKNALGISIFHFDFSVSAEGSTYILLLLLKLIFDPRVNKFSLFPTSSKT